MKRILVCNYEDIEAETRQGRKVLVIIDSTSQSQEPRRAIDISSEPEYEKYLQMDDPERVAGIYSCEQHEEIHPRRNFANFYPSYYAYNPRPLEELVFGQMFLENSDFGDLTD